jgi:hypothetical protein
MVKTNYDPTVIHQFADSLYSQAATIVFTYAIAGMLPGIAVLGYAFIVNEPLGVFGGGFLLVVGGLLGAMRGKTAGFALRLQAQQALCNVQIEYNTRSVSHGQTQPSVYQGQAPHQGQMPSRVA